MDLDKLFTFGAETAQHLFNVQGYLLPMWVGVDKRGHHQPLLVQNMDNKDEVADRIKRFLKQQKVIAYVSMIECWVYEGKEMPPEIREGRSLEHNPDRREAVYILAEDMTGSSMSGGYYILRPEHGKPKLSPLKRHPKNNNVEGRFANMFNDSTTANKGR